MSRFFIMVSLLLQFSPLALRCVAAECVVEVERLPQRKSVDVGSFDVDADHSVIIELNDKTGEVLEIEHLQPSCNCVAAQIDRDTRGLTKVEVRFKAADTAGKFVQPLEVFFKGHATRPLTLLLEGKRNAFFELAGQSIKVDADVKSLSIPFTLREGWSVEKVSALRGFLKDLSINESEGPRLDASLDLESGRASELLRAKLVSAAGDQKLVEVAIQIERRFDLRVIPSTLILNDTGDGWVSRFTLVFDDPETSAQFDKARFSGLDAASEVAPVAVEATRLSRRTVSCAIATPAPIENLIIEGLTAAGVSIPVSH